VRGHIGDVTTRTTRTRTRDEMATGVKRGSARRGVSRGAAQVRTTARQAAATRPAKQGSKQAPRVPVSSRRSGVCAFAAPSEDTAMAKPAMVELPKTPQDIVFVAAEVAPWSKTGGLGDVVGGLPIELAKRGHRVMTVAPRYDQYSDAWDTSVVLEIMGERVGFFHSKKKGVDRVFIDHPCFLAKVWGKTGSKLYGLKSGADFVDNSKRFRIFCEAAIEAARCLPFSYGEDVTFVANDWHSALVPVLLRDVYKPSGQFLDAKCAFCVHNIAFQGRFWQDTWDTLGLPDSSKEIFEFEDGYDKVFTEDEPDEEDEESLKELGLTYAKLNWMKAGFLSSDKNVTVSPNYAEEVMSNPSKGVELDNVIAEAGGIEGIVNGMDSETFNPLKCKFIPVRYGPQSVAEGKAAAKEALQAELGLDVDPAAPLVGFVGRLEEQKGVDVMLAAVDQIVSETNCQVVILGTGKKSYEAKVKKVMGKGGRTAAVVKFAPRVARMIFAGSDYLLVPSRFEPCGLIQMQGMAYGAVPIVASTGGLVDTVKEGVTGFHIGALDPDALVEEDVQAVAETVAFAAQKYGTAAFEEMRDACIKQDLSWSEPARKWEALVEEMKAVEVEEAVAKKESVATPVAKV